MDRVEKNGRGKAEEDPESQGEAVPLPFLAGEEIHLDAKQGAEEAHPETGQEKKSAFSQPYP